MVAPNLFQNSPSTNESMICKKKLILNFQAIMKIIFLHFCFHIAHKFTLSSPTTEFRFRKFVSCITAKWTFFRNKFSSDVLNSKTKYWKKIFYHHETIKKFNFRNLIEERTIRVLISSRSSRLAIKWNFHKCVCIENVQISRFVYCYRKQEIFLLLIKTLMKLNFWHFYF